MLNIGMGIGNLLLDRVNAAGESLQSLSSSMQRNVQRWGIDPRAAEKVDRHHPLLYVSKTAVAVLSVGAMTAGVHFFEGPQPGTIGHLGMMAVGLAMGIQAGGHIAQPSLNAFRRAVSPVIGGAGDALASWAQSNGATPSRPKAINPENNL